MEEKWKLSKVPPGRVYDAVTRKRDPKKDRSHLAWLRTLPCAVLAHPLPGSTPCRFGIEAHHPTGAGEALKDADRRAIPLCGRHHREELHLFAGTFLGWSSSRIHRWESAMSDLYERLGALRKEIEGT